MKFKMFKWKKNDEVPTVVVDVICHQCQLPNRSVPFEQGDRVTEQMYYCTFCKSLNIVHVPGYEEAGEVF